MKTYFNTNYTKRNYECTNIIFIQVPEGEALPNGKWTECNEDAMDNYKGLTPLHRIGEVRFFGYL